MWRSRSWIVSLGLVAVTTLAVNSYGKVIYVDDDAVGANTGVSWEDAYSLMEDALADANSSPGPVEIRVGQGMYPLELWGEEFGNSITIRGGYAGLGQVDPNVQEISTYKSTFTDGTLECTEGNLVLYGCGFSNGGLRCEDANIVLEDCYFERSGRPWPEPVYVLGGTVVAKNCVFERNGTCVGGIGNVKLVGCTFEENGYSHGPVIMLRSGWLAASRCVFRNNECSRRSVIDSANCDLTLCDTSFVENVCASSTYRFNDSVVQVSGGACVARNCIFRANCASGIRVYSGDMEIQGCKFTANRSSTGAGIHISGAYASISNCVFAGNVAETYGGGLRCTWYPAPAIVRNCTFVGNMAGRGGSAVYGAKEMVGSILWDNGPGPIEGRTEDPTLSYCNVEGGWPGEGNIDVDPLFADPGYWDVDETPEDANDDLWVNGDYHLMSQAGRWDAESESWVQDEVTSPCIDAGDPGYPLGLEPFPNGGQVNIGAYAGSVEASKSYLGGAVCNTVIAGDINGDCIVDWADFAIMSSHWLLQEKDVLNSPPTVKIVSPQDGDQFTFGDPVTFRAEAEDADGEVLHVRFHFILGEPRSYAGLVKNGEEEAGGWAAQYEWPATNRGRYLAAWVVAIDNEGAIVKSEKITLYLLDAGENP